MRGLAKSTFLTFLIVIGLDSFGQEFPENKVDSIRSLSKQESLKVDTIGQTDSITVNEQLSEREVIGKNKLKKIRPKDAVKIFVAGLFSIGICVGGIILVVWLYKTYSKNKEAELIRNFGQANAELIRAGLVSLEMTKPMIEKIWGKSFNTKASTNSKGTTETSYYQPYNVKGKTKFKKYVTYLNGQVKEFGDV